MTCTRREAFWVLVITILIVYTPATITKADMLQLIKPLALGRSPLLHGRCSCWAVCVAVSVWVVFYSKMDIFVTGFWLLSVLCLLLYLYTRTAVTTSTDKSFTNFQTLYIVVYLLAMAGDWLQGPYVYALYDYYGMTTHEIEVLFVAGFGSSMVFGTIVGSVADKYGRRLNCMLYGVLYGLACITKHFNNFYILMVGRLLGGIATSILYSAFESWLVYEHNKRGFSGELLSSIFSLAVLGNSVVAILAGVGAQQAANYVGYVAPFDLSLIVLMVMVFVVWRNWSENYGDVTVEPMQGFKNALSSIKTDPKVLYLGLIQSFFEGAMYTFVLEWTPALTPPSDPGAGDDQKVTIPHGYIFAAFMVAIMIGSSLFKILSRYTGVESFMRPVLMISAASLSVPILFPGNQLYIFIGFLVFEVAVGLFWPSMGTMRGKYVPEATRATIMNIFRIPLNLIVVIILTQNLPMRVIFQCCVVFLFGASLCQQALYRLAEATPVVVPISDRDVTPDVNGDVKTESKPTASGPDTEESQA